MKTKIIQNIKIIILGLVVAIGASYVSAGSWSQAPSAGPTNDNTDEPINIGGIPQTKTGVLTLMHLITPDLTITNPDGSTSGIKDGDVLVASGTNTGRVRWGSASASGNLEFAQAYMTRSGSVTSENSYIINPVGGAPASAFSKIFNQTETLGGTNYTVDGLQCNAAAGWKLTGCWEVYHGGDNDVWSTANGCVTNDFRQSSGVELSIMCVK